uniref:NADH dehydrogenase subunit 6 n=1 Tax=Sternolophus rufipes TaxID=1383104 RepID=UPI0023F3FB8A|nr:NADH dehydrogenase subunit 6 [Sternolophus rufipes]WED07060.1 NADH dehydrogenase subunit 6 [Sternolophus rufipes]
MLMLLNSTMILSIAIVMVNHPMSMGLTLLMQVLCISLISGLMSFNFWFSYILFLIMIGGMLVLFIYMTSIASNEKFSHSKNLMLMITTMLTLSMILTIFTDQYFIEYWNFSLQNIDNFNFSLVLTKFLNFPFNSMLAVIILYLFITLIAVVKISNIKYGPLRQMN